MQVPKNTELDKYITHINAIDSAGLTSHSLQKEKVLCLHCGRTGKNGVRCMGKCIEDNEY